MYKMQGNEFKQLVNRAFIDLKENQYKAVKVLGSFETKTCTWSHSDFNVLQFDSSFDEELKVVNFSDFNHTSFHFQLKGHSNAKISGFRSNLPLSKGEYGVMNCVDPISNFKFPRQADYGYICIGVRQDYFLSLLRQFGNDWASTAKDLEQNRPFTLFDNPQHYGPALSHILRAITHPPVADMLKRSFICHKIEELLLIILNERLEKKHSDPLKIFNQRDIGLLHDLKAFLDQNFLSSHSLSTLARQAGINEFKLKKGFKTLFKFTVFGYIHHLRMKHSLALLQSRELPLGAIAALVGYQSDMSFVRAFKNYYGFQPASLLKFKKN
ncbi:helix-turn-helix transcriptional regulator [Olivibacter sp. SDN3]|uniref:helix-turn-helix transcriptional regulator n=1 Tax=Olivibacter sp. SDN3 TaxID=2764720 RepID=UPI001650FE27|nr:AraC family transcriptional regulator [Olivibacter sp. SDN3]QNL48239.1 helix-turn-helix transcriptional regulator [Olivibacter sp. SDN3]